MGLDTNRNIAESEWQIRQHVTSESAIPLPANDRHSRTTVEHFSKAERRTTKIMKYPNDRADTPMIETYDDFMREDDKLYDAIIPQASDDGATDFSPDSRSIMDRSVGLQAFSFGTFCLFPKKRLLISSGRRLPIGGRALDILIALVLRHGEVVTQAELMAFAWPNLHVEVCNIRVHIAFLQRTLGTDRQGRRYIVNVAARGYVFVGEVQELSANSL